MIEIDLFYVAQLLVYMHMNYSQDLENEHDVSSNQYMGEDRISYNFVMSFNPQIDLDTCQKTKTFMCYILIFLEGDQLKFQHIKPIEHFFIYITLLIESIQSQQQLDIYKKRGAIICKMDSKKAKTIQLKFLIATDVHLGHAQNHIQLGNDSYNAFEQVLSTAKKQNVDFLLLGGDLFDEVNPSQKCIFKCLNLLRDNIFGDRQLSIGVKGIMPNFSNQNLNIALPIFTIHGNHDYPSNDFGKISVCDLLHASNYVNYFGKHLNLMDQGQKKIVIKPLIFQKSGLSTKLALYGLGYIKDLKLHNMFSQNMVLFEEPQKIQETVCIFILHQNRFKGKKGGVGASYQNCIHPSQFPKWMNLIIWGHEHQAIYKVQSQSDQLIFQPGSTVITSYIQAQSFKKQCGLISIKTNKQFQVKPIFLQKSYRPMFTRSYFLEQILEKHGNEGNMNFDQFFDQQLSKILGQKEVITLAKKPIIRIKIDYTNLNIIRLIKVQQKYKNLVANSNKIFTYTQKRVNKKNAFTLEDEEILNMIKNSRIPRNIGREIELSQEILQKLLQQFATNKITFFQVAQLKDMISESANVEGKSTIADIKYAVSKQIEKKCGQNKKDIVSFQQNNDQDFKRLYEKIVQNANDCYKGTKNQNFKKADIKADIDRFRNSHTEKQKQVQQLLTSNHLKQPLPSQSQTQIMSKTTNRISQLGSIGSKQNQRRSSLMNPIRNSENQGKKSFKLSNSSDEDDCCQRAERQGYRENQTRYRFERANQMIMEQNNKKQKGKKKQVKFKDQ